jgi:hypothetical protein
MKLPVTVGGISTVRIHLRCPTSLDSARLQDGACRHGVVCVLSWRHSPACKLRWRLGPTPLLCAAPPRRATAGRAGHEGLHEPGTLGATVLGKSASNMTALQLLRHTSPYRRGRYSRGARLTLPLLKAQNWHLKVQMLHCQQVPKLTTSDANILCRMLKAQVSRGDIRTTAWQPAHAEKPTLYS